MLFLPGRLPQAEHAAAEAAKTIAARDDAIKALSGQVRVLTDTLQSSADRFAKGEAAAAAAAARAERAEAEKALLAERAAAGEAALERAREEGRARLDALQQEGERKAAMVANVVAALQGEESVRAEAEREAAAAAGRAREAETEAAVLRNALEDAAAAKKAAEHASEAARSAVQHLRKKATQYKQDSRLLLSQYDRWLAGTLQSPAAAALGAASPAAMYFADRTPYSGEAIFYFACSTQE